MERLTNEAMAASFAFEHEALSAEYDVMLGHLGHLGASDASTPPDAKVSRARWQRVKTTAEHVRQAVSETSLSAARAGDHCPDREFLVFWRSRVAQWCYTVERCAERYGNWLARIPESSVAAMSGLIAYSDFRLGAIENGLTGLSAAADRIVAAQRGAVRIADA